MKELGIFYGGLSGKTKNDFENGNAKFISYMNVYSNDAINIDVTDKVLIGDNEKQNKIQYGDIIFIGSYIISGVSLFCLSLVLFKISKHKIKNL